MVCVIIRNRNVMAIFIEIPPLSAEISCREINVNGCTMNGRPESIMPVLPIVGGHIKSNVVLVSYSV